MTTDFTARCMAGAAGESAVAAGESAAAAKAAIEAQQDTIADGGHGYAIINGARVYVSATAPTGDTIPDGSIWIGG